jgi:hypothetical protein
MLKNDNKCLVCGEVLHPGWWNNFGLCEKNEELQTFVTTLKLDASQKELKQTLHKEIGFCHMDGEFPILILVFFKDFLKILRTIYLVCACCLGLHIGCLSHVTHVG